MIDPCVDNRESGQCFFRTMSFVLQIGGTASTCEDADSGEDVVVEYRAEGSTSFLRITTFTYNGEYLLSSICVVASVYMVHCSISL